MCNGVFKEQAETGCVPAILPSEEEMRTSSRKVVFFRKLNSKQSLKLINSE
jgi:hypothetical protein